MSSSPLTPRRAVPIPSSPLTPRRTPLSPSKSISVQQFHQNHISQFAHLHKHSNENLKAARLEEEQHKLDEERRLGREKRISLLRTQLSRQSSEERRSAWRPLSLLAKREGDGHTRSQSQQGYHGDGPRRVVSQHTARTMSLYETSVANRSVSDQPRASTLEVLIEGSPSLGPEPTPLSLHNSTYSWATSFSGETSELRTAAHYVPTTPTEEFLSSPERTQQRRKRIQAIAHTVRQLEGIGSREVEDPNFYDVLEKAWLGRPGVDILPAEDMPPTPIFADEPPVTYTPDYAVEGDYYPREYPTGTPALSGSVHASPSEPTFKTPHDPSDGFDNRSYPSRGSSNSASRSGRQSVRYSYASTLHDLALGGGWEQGDRLMAEKAWMTTPQGHWADFDTPPPSRPLTRRVDAEVPPALRLESPITIEPERTLRKYNTTIGSLRDQAVPPPNAEAGPSKPWGLGFVSAWWETPPPLAPISPGEKSDFRVPHEPLPPDRPLEPERQRRTVSNPYVDVDHLSLAWEAETTNESVSSNRSRQTSMTHWTISSLHPVPAPTEASSSGSEIGSYLSQRAHWMETPVDRNEGILGTPPRIDFSQRARADSAKSTSRASSQWTKEPSLQSTTDHDVTHPYPTRPPPAQIHNSKRQRQSYASSTFLDYTPTGEDVYQYQRCPAPIHTVRGTGTGRETRVLSMLPAVKRREAEEDGLPMFWRVMDEGVYDEQRFTPKIERRPYDMDVGCMEETINPKIEGRRRMLFFLGFLLPFLWLISGWGASTALDGDTDSGTGRRRRNSGWWSWARTPDPWVGRSRVAAVMMGSGVLVGLVVAVVVLALR